MYGGQEIRWAQILGLAGGIIDEARATEERRV